MILQTCKLSEIIEKCFIHNVSIHCCEGLNKRIHSHDKVLLYAMPCAQTRDFVIVNNSRYFQFSAECQHLIILGSTPKSIEVRSNS